MIFKVLGFGGSPCHGGYGKWHLPTETEPGEWMPYINDPIPCRHGYHLCDGLEQLLHWLGPEIYEAEYAGERIDDVNKIVVSQARLLRKLPWDRDAEILFMCDCVHHLVPFSENKDIPKWLEWTRHMVETKGSDAFDPVSLTPMTTIESGMSRNPRYMIGWLAENITRLPVAFAAHECAKIMMNLTPHHELDDYIGGYYRRERQWQARRLGRFLGVDP